MSDSGRQHNTHLGPLRIAFIDLEIVIHMNYRVEKLIQYMQHYYAYYTKLCIPRPTYSYYEAGMFANHLHKIQCFTFPTWYSHECSQNVFLKYEMERLHF